MAAVATAAPLDFVALFRHGTFELYLGAPLLLVQTSTYGTYPVTAAKVGFAGNGTSATAIWQDLKAWHMSLDNF